MGHDGVGLQGQRLQRDLGRRLPRRAHAVRRRRQRELGRGSGTVDAVQQIHRGACEIGAERENGLDVIGWRIVGRWIMLYGCGQKKGK